MTGTGLSLGNHTSFFFDRNLKTSPKQVCRVRDLSLAGWRISLEYERWRVNCPGCGGLHVEHLDWLANNSRYT